MSPKKGAPDPVCATSIVRVDQCVHFMQAHAADDHQRQVYYWPFIITQVVAYYVISLHLAFLYILCIFLKLRE